MARCDLWLCDLDPGKPRNGHYWFEESGLYLKTVRWKEWRGKHLRPYQEALLDRYYNDPSFPGHKWRLMAIAPKGKQPIEKEWPTLQRREAELVLASGGNIAVKCGAGVNNGMLIVDLDDTDTIYSPWNNFDTLTQRTGRGFHQYYYLTKTLNDKTWEEITKLPQDTIRYGGGMGEYGLVPLSLHPTGKIYDFLDYTKPILDFNLVVKKCL